MDFFFGAWFSFMIVGGLIGLNTVKSKKFNKIFAIFWAIVNVLCIIFVFYKIHSI